MRSTFKRGPGSGFGLSNLKPPHTLTNEENETVIEGGAAPLLGSVCPWRCTPSGVGHREQALAAGLGTPRCPQSEAEHQPPGTIARG